MQPRLICICGPNGAGKSTYTRTVATMENLLVIDPDKLAADGLSPIAAGKAAAKMARLFLENGVSFARESTLTSHFDFILMSEAKKKGYSIELVYIGLESSDLAWARVASRAARGGIFHSAGSVAAGGAARGGHSVPYEDVIRRFARSLENLPKAIALADKATILDNSTQGYRLIQVAK